MIRNPPQPTPSAPDAKDRAATAGERRSTERASENHPSTEPQSSRPRATPPRRGGWGFWLVLLVLVGTAGAGWFYRGVWWPKVLVLFAEKKQPPRERIVPVVTATAKQRDLDLYLNGLGTVTALKTVVIRSRVEGEVINVPFTEGQMVEKGDLIAEIDPRPYEVQRDQAQGQLARDEATLKVAKTNLERLQQLLRNNSVSKQEVDNQEAVVEQTEGLIQSDQAMVANAELQLSYCKITSPLKGRIGLRLVDRGNIVRANEPNGLAVITQLDPIAITFTISQDEIPRVQARMQSGKELKVDAYDRGFKTKLASGKLLATDNQVDSATGTLRLKAIIDQNSSVLFPNQFVNTRLLVDTLHDATVVPAAAVQRGPNSTFVYVVTEDNTVDLREVGIGATEAGETVIEHGLETGEVVVIEGLDKLQPKAKVAPRDVKAKGGDKQKPKQPPETSSPQPETKSKEEPASKDEPASSQQKSDKPSEPATSGK
jgi:multidrug efflux system membrane fusion protein